MTAHHDELPDPETMLGQQFWDDRYASHSRLWSGNPNRELVANVADLTPGTALDIGCGEGADAIWLAQRGWQVSAFDVSDVAIGRAREHAAAADVAERITFSQADVRDWEPDATYDLVTLQYLHLPVENYRRFARAVATGGRLLVAAHHPSDLDTPVRRPRLPELFFTAEELAAVLDPDDWEVLVSAAAPHPATDPDGNQVTVHDTVLMARRR